MTTFLGEILSWLHIGVKGLGECAIILRYIFSSLVCLLNDALIPKGPKCQLILGGRGLNDSPAAYQDFSQVFQVGKEKTCILLV